MGGPSSSSSASRLKREDHRRTKHDSSFSKWKILIGPSDWEDHLLNKEGAARYRVQNLPAEPGPGVYEIGVAVWDLETGSGRDVGKMDPDRIVVVYLGQAENVRVRLQRYGRGGAHLDNNGSNGGLFKEVFGRGLPIVYRWALMSSKKDAERTEAELLARFDYAWNKVGNVTKRPTDALLKIDEVSSRTGTTTPRVLEMLRSLTEKKVGIPIKASMPSSPNKVCDDGSNQGAVTESNKISLFARVFKFGRSQPRMVVPHDDDALECQSLTASRVCGVTLADGSICTSQAVEGRKRCPEHKGKKNFAANGMDLNSPSKQTNIGIPDLQEDVSAEEKPTVDGVDGEFFVPICGVILPNGSPCMTKPVMGRKRCEDHKGKRIQQFSPPKISYQEASSIDVDATISDKDSVSSRNLAIVNDDNCCGVTLSCGSYCKRLPVKGRKRCEEHKGMRVHGYLSQ